MWQGWKKTYSYSNEQWRKSDDYNWLLVFTTFFPPRLIVFSTLLCILSSSSSLPPLSSSPAFLSSFLTQSSHLSLSLPRLLLPCSRNSAVIFGSLSSAIRSTCPAHFSLLHTSLSLLSNNEWSVTIIFEFFNYILLYSIKFSLFPTHINISYNNNNVHIMCRIRGGQKTVLMNVRPVTIHVVNFEHNYHWLI